MAQIRPSTTQDMVCPDCEGRKLTLFYYGGDIREYRVECRDCKSTFELGDFPADTKDLEPIVSQFFQCEECGVEFEDDGSNSNICEDCWDSEDEDEEDE